MMGLGFWWGGRLVVSTQQQAMIDYPIPQDFYTNPDYTLNRLYADSACVYAPPASFGNADYVAYTDEAYETCVCSIPWTSVANSIDTSDNEMAVLAREMGYSGDDVVIMECGCPTGQNGSKLNSSCISAGRTVAVFFSVMIAGFMMAMIPPAISSIKKAQLSAAKLYQVIDRRPDIDSSNLKSTGNVLKTMEGRISITNMDFQYPTSATKTFEDINLEIAAGETIALVGESGSGKSVSKVVIELSPDTLARLVDTFSFVTDHCQIDQSFLRS